MDEVREKPTHHRLVCADAHQTPDISAN